MRQCCDIFCTVIDNFGDAGVCWRLARQLTAEYGWQVRLWIDDLQVLQHLWPEVSVSAEVQRVAGVEIRRWGAPFVEIAAADVVIEAFACTLPQTYVAAMMRRTRPSLWINLEYLSAESWVSECHGLASPQVHSALKKYFFFPGFAAGTGGLLSERDLHARRLAFQVDTTARQRLFGEWDIGGAGDGDITVMSLFAYPSAPVPALLKALASSPTPILCLVPEGQLLTRIAPFFGESALAVGSVRARGALTVCVLPFLRQDDYDRLLWACDINCVRGEDSFVRAQWAARPLLWQIYPQQGDAHWDKLDAFLDLYKPMLPVAAADALAAAWQAWNGRGDIGASWQALQRVLPALRQGAKGWEERLHSATNLAAALVQFCANHV